MQSGPIILGNAAIGTRKVQIFAGTSPLYALEVVASAVGGSPAKQYNSNAAGYAGIDFYEANGTTYVGTYGYGNSGVGAPYTSVVYAAAANKDWVLFVGATGVTEALRVSSAGALKLTQTGGVTLTNPAAATLQIGPADNATAVAQTVQAQNAATGNNNGAATFTLIASRSVGTGTSGDLVLQTGKNGNGSGVLATPTTALTIKGETQDVVIAAGKTFQIGNAATTGLVAGVLAATTNASIVITDSGGQAYRIPCII